MEKDKTYRQRVETLFADKIQSFPNGNKTNSYANLTDWRLTALSAQ